MAKLNKGESASVMSIMDKPGWQSLMKLVAMTINDLNSRPLSGNNEFEVLRSVFTRQAKVEALTEFFNGIENGESLSD